MQNAHSGFEVSVNDRKMFIHNFLLQFIPSIYCELIISNRPETERDVAEKFGIGVPTGSTFTLKENFRDDIKKMCLPSIKVKEMKGIITHVRTQSWQLLSDYRK